MAANPWAVAADKRELAYANYDARVANALDILRHDIDAIAEGFDWVEGRRLIHEVDPALFHGGPEPCPYCDGSQRRSRAKAVKRTNPGR